jgi:hypothetical protein
MPLLFEELSSHITFLGASLILLAAAFNRTCVMLEVHKLE